MTERPGLEPDDAALLRAIGEGSEAAFRSLFTRWAPRLGRFLVRATGSRETGEDLLQEAFLRVLRAADRYAPEAPPGAWLYRICANLSYSHWRRESGAARGRVPSGWHGPAPEPSPDATRLREHFSRDLESALADLPVNQRMTFLLKAGQGLTYEEVAEVLDCPEGTAKSRFHHAVLRLRVVLREWEDGIGTDAPPPAPREARPHDM
jgi:RNA polymerase sigma-70 factor, ECF subfamily